MGKGGGPAPLLCPGEASSGVLCVVLGSLAQDGHGTSAVSPEKACEDDGGLDRVSYNQWLRELGLFRLQVRRLRGDLNRAHKCVNGGCPEDGTRLFSGVQSKTWDSGYKSKQRKFHLNRR